MTVAITPHLSQSARTAATLLGSTIASMRSCDSLVRTSSGDIDASRSGTFSSSTRMPPSP